MTTPTRDQQQAEQLEQYAKRGGFQTGSTRVHFWQEQMDDFAAGARALRQHGALVAALRGVMAVVGAYDQHAAPEWNRMRADAFAQANAALADASPQEQK